MNITKKYLKTTVQESKGKYTSPIPSGLAKLIGLQKGDKFVWNLSENKVDIKNLKFVIKIVKGDHDRDVEKENRIH
jgi:hypothetical protein